MKHTKGKWGLRKLFKDPIPVIDTENNEEWFTNTIDVTNKSGRIIASLNYQTDTKNQGWGKTNNIPEWEANAKLIAAAPKLLEALKMSYELLSLIENTIQDEKKLTPKIIEMLSNSIDLDYQAIKKATE